MIEANRWKLGLFIIIGVTLLLGGIFFFGVSQFLVPKIKVMTIFTESVDGLSIGSPVKYNGVPMGTVSKIMIEHRGNILVYMDLYPNVLAAKDRKHITKNMKSKKYINKYIESYVDRGFRCSLQLVGISGNKYIGIEQYNIEKGELINPKLQQIIGDNLYIPSIPTFVSGAVANVSKLLNQVAKVNFTEITSNVNNTFATLDSLLNKVNTLIKTLESQGLQRILLNTTSKLDQTLDAVTELSNQISEQPNSVLRGNESRVIFPAK